MSALEPNPVPLPLPGSSSHLTAMLLLTCSLAAFSTSAFAFNGPTTTGEEKALDDGLEYIYLSGEGTALADIDGDGDEDALRLDASTGLALYTNEGKGRFLRMGSESGLPTELAAQRVVWLDFDRDGAIDLHVTTADGEHIFRGLGTGAFEPVRLPSPRVARGANAASQPGNGSDEPDQATTPSPSPSRPGTTAGVSRASISGLGTTSNPGGLNPGIDPCAGGLTDLAVPGSSLLASSVPVLGMLYPLSTSWWVDGAAGRVGLGNTMPTTRLDVAGRIRSTSGGIVFPDGSMLTTATATGVAGPDSPWTAAGTDLYFDGDVGIGTQGPPQTRLQLSEGGLLVDRNPSATNRTIIEVSGAQTAGYFGTLSIQNYDDRGSATDYEAAAIRARVGNAPDTGVLEFYTGDYRTTPPRWVIDETGNSRFLGDVEVVSTSTNQTRIASIGGASSTPADAYSRIAFSNSDASGSATPYVGAMIESFRENANEGNFVFSTHSGFALEERMRITSSGDVGIGVSDPQEKLDVDGLVRSSGGFQFGSIASSPIQTTAIYSGTQKTTLGPGDFIPRTAGQALNDPNAGVSGTDSHTIIAGINLPHGANITKLTVRGRACGSSPLRARLYRRSGFGSELLQASASISPSCTDASASSFAGTAVNNDSDTFHVQVDGSGLWHWGDIQLYSVEIEWHLN